MQSNKPSVGEDGALNEVVAALAAIFVLAIMMALDELNPVKVLCSYASYWESITGVHVTEGRVAAAAGISLCVLAISERRALLYYVLRLFFRCTINNMFFRSVEIVGMENLPKQGPVILTGNHNNQFIDGLVLVSNCSRQISFMIAQKSWERPLVGFLARSFHCFPVARPQDSAFRGAGCVTSDGKGRLTGDGTRFTEQVKAGAMVELEGQTFKVKEIVSDTELLVDARVGPTTVDDIGVSYKVHPKVDQSAMYNNVYGGLRKGRCLGIFPEGGSHDRTDLLPLKAGVAVIALDAYTKYHMTVPIVPVGLNYFSGHRFGGRVVVEFGPPIVVPEQVYIQNETDRKGAVEALLQLIATGMRGVIVPTPDYHTLQMIYMARRLYVPDGLKLSAEQTMDLNRRFAVAIRRILRACHTTGDSSPRPGSNSPGGSEKLQLSEEDYCFIDEFKAEMEDYMATLKRLGLRDHQVRQIGWWGISDLVGRCFYLMMTVCLACLPQLLFNLPVAFIATRLATTEQQKSLRASTVKLAARDVVMSYKVIYVLILVPCLYVFYGSLILLFCDWSPTTTVLVLAMCPLSAFLGMKASEQGVRAYADIVPLFKRLLPGPRAEQDALPARRAALQKKLNQAVKRFGPLLGDLYQRKSVDWLKEMGWFTYAAASASAAEGHAAPPPIMPVDQSDVAPNGVGDEDRGAVKRSTASSTEGKEVVE